MLFHLIILMDCRSQASFNMFKFHLSKYSIATHNRQVMKDVMVMVQWVKQP